jgi:DNA replication protein DnaC
VGSTLALPEFPVPDNVYRLTLTDAEREWLAGRYPSANQTPKDCVTCRGAKRFRWYGPGRAEVRDYRCPCAKQFILYRRMLHSGIGLALQRLDWDDGNGIPPEPFARVTRYADNVERYVHAGIGLVLSGEARGVGKTMCAALVLKDLICNHGVHGYMTTFSALLDAYTDGWPSPAARADFVARIRNAQVLLIDDLGREQRGRISVAGSALEDLVRHRCQHALPTLLTTNLTQAEIASGYGGHVVSVLAEAALVVDFPATATDYRPAAQVRLEDEVAQGLTRPVVCS